MKTKYKISILGYGSQGRAWALNIRDSGCAVCVGIPSGDKSRITARKDGFKDIKTVAGAVKNADIVIFAFPDHLQGRVFEKDIKPNLKDGAALIFLHGFAIHFETIIPSKTSDVILLAPLGPGVAVREKFLENKSIGYFYCIHQNATGKAKMILNSLIKALKINHKAMIKTSFEDEAIGDLFGEQTVLCGGLTQLIKSGYDTLVESGLSSDKAYLEVAYQLDLIVDLIKNYGIEGMYNRISVAARYGSYLTGPELIDAQTKKKMKAVLTEIKKGSFAKKLNSLTSARIKKLNKDIKKLSTPSFEKSAKKFSPMRNKNK